MLAADKQIERGVQCSACGAWGCTACAHHHHLGLGATTYTERAVSQGRVEVFVDMKWVHDSCCNCDADGVYYRQQVRWKRIIESG